MILGPKDRPSFRPSKRRSNERVRIEFVLDDETRARLDDLKAQMGANSKAEIIRKALQVFQFVSRTTSSDNDLPVVLKDTERLYVAHNLTPRVDRRRLLARADALADEFRSLLADVKKEEEIQTFLSEHPEFIYPDFIECQPRFRLGDDFVTDYVFRVQGQDGEGYVFVEIERVSKRIFTAGKQFTADFTQAKNQLLEWEAWVRRNHSYVEQKLPSLYQPNYHLIMGRNSELNGRERQKLATEFKGTSRIFSTYDDLLERYKTIVRKLSLNDD